VVSIQRSPPPSSGGMHPNQEEVRQKSQGGLHWRTRSSWPNSSRRM